MDGKELGMADTEKITINLSGVDLGRIDLLAEEGFYSNRTDFIRSAIRKELEVHRDAVTQSVARGTAALGMLVYTRRTLEEYRKKNERLTIKVVGGVQLADDISPELARETIQSLKVYGVLRASQAVKDALADRMR
jgi:Arc/MetJ-type ribon-helix-helix transcriptional regulator